MPVYTHKYESVERVNETDYRRIIKDLRLALIESNALLKAQQQKNDKLINKTKRYS